MLKYETYLHAKFRTKALFTDNRDQPVHINRGVHPKAAVDLTKVCRRLGRGRKTMLTRY